MDKHVEHGAIIIQLNLTNLTFEPDYTNIMLGK